MSREKFFTFFADQFSRYRAAKQNGMIFFELPFDKLGIHTQLDGKPITSFASNDYLSFLTDSGLRESAVNAIQNYGTGTGSSMLGSGSLKIHHELAENLADFVGKESCILFNTGFSAMMAFLSANIINGASLLVDEACHRCIVDGVKMGNGYLNSDVSHAAFYQHNSLPSLTKRYARLKTDVFDAAYEMVFTEGVFSTHGDLGNLAELEPFCQQNGALLAIDDAHGIGVLGDHGRGTANHLGLDHRVDYILGTLGKGLASSGGFIAGPKEELEYLRLILSSYIYSTSLSPASVIAAAYTINELRKSDERQQRLWKNIEYFKQGLTNNHFEFGHSQSAVIPLFIRTTEQTLLYCSELLKHGFFAVGFVAPGVPKGQELIRFSINTGHTFGEIDDLLAALIKIRHSFPLMEHHSILPRD